VEDRDNPSTATLPAKWDRVDEWYNFDVNPRPGVKVLLKVDENTYTGGKMGADHPVAWYHAFDGGRAWYSALGHTQASYSEPEFLAHLRGGIIYAMGINPSARLGQPRVRLLPAVNPAGLRRNLGAPAVLFPWSGGGAYSATGVLLPGKQAPVLTIVVPSR
jgi:hypothetical protein